MLEITRDWMEWLSRRIFLERALWNEGFTMFTMNKDYDFDDELKKAGWWRNIYTREEQKNVPQLDLTIREHREYGINLTVNSFPFNDLYHFHTGSPVIQEEALKLFRGYMTAAKEGKKFSP